MRNVEDEVKRHLYDTPITLSFENSRSAPF